MRKLFLLLIPLLFIPTLIVQAGEFVDYSGAFDWCYRWDFTQLPDSDGWYGGVDGNDLLHSTFVTGLGFNDQPNHAGELKAFKNFGQDVIIGYAEVELSDPFIGANPGYTFQVDEVNFSYDYGSWWNGETILSGYVNIPFEYEAISGSSIQINLDTKGNDAHNFNAYSGYIEAIFLAGYGDNPFSGSTECMSVSPPFEVDETVDVFKDDTSLISASETATDFVHSPITGSVGNLSILHETSITVDGQTYAIDNTNAIVMTITDLDNAVEVWVKNPTVQQMDVVTEGCVLGDPIPLSDGSGYITTIKAMNSSNDVIRHFFSEHPTDDESCAPVVEIDYPHKQAETLLSNDSTAFVPTLVESGLLAFHSVSQNYGNLVHSTVDGTVVDISPLGYNCTYGTCYAITADSNPLVTQQLDLSSSPQIVTVRYEDSQSGSMYFVEHIVANPEPYVSEWNEVKQGCIIGESIRLESVSDLSVLVAAGLDEQQLLAASTNTDYGFAMVVVRDSLGELVQPSVSEYPGDNVPCNQSDSDLSECMLLNPDLDTEDNIAGHRWLVSNDDKVVWETSAAIVTGLTNIGQATYIDDVGTNYTLLIFSE